jgi:hypothetical protein
MPAGFASERSFDVLFQSVVNLPLFKAGRGKGVDFGMLTRLQRPFQQGFPQASGTIKRMVPYVPGVGTGSIRQTVAPGGDHRQRAPWGP